MTDNSLRRHTIPCRYVPDTRTSKYMNQKLIEIEGEIRQFTIVLMIPSLLSEYWVEQITTTKASVVLQKSRGQQATSLASAL